MASTNASTNASTIPPANTPTATCTRRLSINAAIFNSAPIRTIKQLIGPNAQLLSYKVNSIITPFDEILVDVVYKSLPLSSFAIYYIPIDSIKHLIPNSEKYIATINSISVKLNNPKLNEFSNYLPVRVKNTIINDTDAYEKYYSTIDDSTFELNTSSNPHSQPLAYFATTVSNPLNSLITPLSLIGANESASFSFELSEPPKLYPDTFKQPKSPYTMEDMIRYYKQTTATIPSLSLIETITPATSFPAENNATMSTTAYVLDIDVLPSDKPIRGIVLLQPKRIPTYLLFYPSNAYTISPDELKSIKKFVNAEVINFNNYHYLKKE